MKPSEITDALIAEYLRLDYSTMTTTEKAQIATLHTVATEYIKSYTGLCDKTVTAEVLTVSTTDTKVFTTKYSPIVSGTLKVYVSGVQKTEDTDFTTDYSTGEITFTSVPAATPTADYKAGIDAYQDLVIAIYVLCQDMYDNRAMYVDKSNINRVVDCVLGMHCVNLL